MKNKPVKKLLKIIIKKKIPGCDKYARPIWMYSITDVQLMNIMNLSSFEKRNKG